MTDYSGVIENFDKIMQVIYLLVVIIAGLKVERHVTVKEANRVIDLLDSLAKKTKTKLDDSLVGLARLINSYRADTVTKVTPPN
jgi:uncharacterized protein YxeA